jgi:hypothetical protein
MEKELGQSLDFQDVSDKMLGHLKIIFEKEN